MFSIVMNDSGSKSLHYFLRVSHCCMLSKMGADRRDPHKSPNASSSERKSQLHGYLPLELDHAILRVLVYCMYACMYLYMYIFFSFIDRTTLKKSRGN